MPWAAVAHRRRFPDTALVAAYMTDFPTVYVERPFSKYLGRPVGNLCAHICYWYCHALYRRFDAVFALSENGGGTRLRALGIDYVDVVPLGVEVGEFAPQQRDPRVRRKLGLADDQPLLIYAGRLDGEKKPQVVADAFRRLPESLGAKLALIGEGPLRDEIAALGDDRIVMPGYMKSRPELAGWLASADIYVSAMADETFGVSIIEAQASGLPVVGIAGLPYRRGGGHARQVDTGYDCRDARPRERRDRPARPGRRFRRDGGQHPRGLERRSPGDGRAGPRPCAAVQLGPQHGGPVRPSISGRTRAPWLPRSRGDVDRRSAAGRSVTGSTLIHSSKLK